MFEVGFTEILLIFGIALLVLGPEKLPKLAADVGRWAGRARSMARQLRTQLEQETTQLNPLAGIDTDLGTGSNGHNSNSIHTPATAADAASRSVPAQLADQSPEPAGPAPEAVEPPVTAGASSSPDATAPAAHDGR